MKKIILVNLFIGISLIAFCQGFWTQKADIGTITREDAVGFAIGTNGYTATGALNTGDVNDCWEYNSVTNSWTQKANFPGNGRRCACGYAFGGKGYVGLGASYNGSYTFYTDFYEFDPVANSWTAKANFPSTGRNYAYAFSVNKDCYVGGGGNGIIFGDLWDYDVNTNTWIQKNNPPFSARYAATAFTVNGYAYVGTGNNGSSYLSDFWQYNNMNDTWTQKAGFPGSIRDHAVGFAIQGQGYMGSGYNGSNWYKDFYVYNPSADSWSSISNLTGSVRCDAFAFTLGNKGYVGTGWSGVTSTSYLNDLWEYTPSSAGIDQIGSTGEMAFNIYPNPVKNILCIELNNEMSNNISLKIFNVFGQVVLSKESVKADRIISLDVSNLSQGQYMINVNSGNSSVSRVFIK